MRIFRSHSNRIFTSSSGSVDCMDVGLTTEKGAQTLINAIGSHRHVSQLIMSQNDLRDEGCILLFEFLNSDEGRRNIKKISLNSNSIGDRGLHAIAQYLENNSSLKELFLQNNAFECTDPSLAVSLASAINSSSLEVLTMSTNIRLSDSFAAHFLPSLHSPSLKELHMSALGLTPRAAATLVNYVSSPCCRLHTLKLNGNSLGFRGVRKIIRAIQHSNFRLISVEMYSNEGPASVVDDTTDKTSEEERDNPGTWKQNLEALNPILLRNNYLSRQVQKEAVALLKTCRALLFQSSSAAPALHQFIALPPELQLQILSFHSPVLSTSQITRIYNYASSPTTLSSLLPPFSTSGTTRRTSASLTCLPDPGTITQGQVTCSEGECPGPSLHVVCQRQESKMDWLEAIGCMCFEPEV